MRTNTASAKWRGTLWEGNGQMKLPHVSKEITYTAKSRFEDGEGSNPEELIAAGKGYQPKLVSTEARVTILKKEEGFTITKSELKTSAEVPDISEETFMELAETAKKNCPVSRALASVEITLEASLVKA
jgi:osmotically inducible protein OsmC